jgi:hypothetical protein
MRAKLNTSGSMIDAVVQMSEGNPGAITALMTLIKRGMEGFMGVLQLDDMNMRGPQIWVAYSDYCGKDDEKFYRACMDRDAAMVDMVNDHGGAGGERAVVSGASFQHAGR